MSADNYKRFFTEADADGSGYLTLEELSAILRKNGYKGTDCEIRVGIMHDSLLSSSAFFISLDFTK